MVALIADTFIPYKFNYSSYSKTVFTPFLLSLELLLFLTVLHDQYVFFSYFKII